MLDYSQILSDRVQIVKPSGIRKFFDLAASMKDCNRRAGAAPL